MRCRAQPQSGSPALQTVSKQTCKLSYHPGEFNPVDSAEDFPFGELQHKTQAEPYEGATQRAVS